MYGECFNYEERPRLTDPSVVVVWRVAGGVHGMNLDSIRNPPGSTYVFADQGGAREETDDDRYNDDDFTRSFND